MATRTERINLTLSGTDGQALAVADGTNWDDLWLYQGRSKFAGTANVYCDRADGYSTDQAVHAARAVGVRYIGATSLTADHYAEVELSSLGSAGSGGSIGPAVRVAAAYDDTSTNNRAYYFFIVRRYGISPTSDTIAILGKKIAGSNAAVLYSAVDNSWTTGDKVGLEIVGTTLSACRNGTPLGGSYTVDVSGGDHLSSGSVGFVGTQGSQAPATDTFWAGDLTSGSSIAPLAASYYAQLRA